MAALSRKMASSPQPGLARRPGSRHHPDGQGRRLPSRSTLRTPINMNQTCLSVTLPKRSSRPERTVSTLPCVQERAQ
jgi:hypothetical protein